MRRTILLVLSGVTLCAAGSIALLFAIRPPIEQEPLFERTVTTNNFDYKETIARLEAQRLSLATRFQTASPSQRTALIGEARTVILGSIYNDLFPAWYGTAWDFNGTSETPQQGKIACGYFVSTVLRDAGLKVERVRLAQQASENIILSLTTNDFVKRFRGVPLGEFVTAIRNWGSGIYIVGLDVHVGFIVNTGDEVYFIHSSYEEPYKVIKEMAIDSRILAASNYRVLGKVFADAELISNWLARKAIATRIAQR
jgi:hypothetical protein